MAASNKLSLRYCGERRSYFVIFDYTFSIVSLSGMKKVAKTLKG
jgi:hypothetical protein